MSNGDLPVALETAGGLIVVVIFPGALDIDGGGEVAGFCTVLFAVAVRGGETGAVVVGGDDGATPAG
jgi:hypothetical protein